jgi:proline iminopeptidase
MVVLGHSWGGLLALEYAIRHPERVSHLILMDTAPASHRDWLALRAHLARAREAADVEALQSLASSESFAGGDLEIEAEYYRIHFKPAVRNPEHLSQVVARLRTHFTKQTALTARAIEQRLYDQTWRRSDYDLNLSLRNLEVPTLIIHGAEDLIPVEAAANIAEAMPAASLVVLEECGHFAYLEHPDEVHHLVSTFIEGTG